jgi:hypothetical protein
MSKIREALVAPDAGHFASFEVPQATAAGRPA